MVLIDTTGHGMAGESGQVEIRNRLSRYGRLVVSRFAQESPGMDWNGRQDGECLVIAGRGETSSGMAGKAW